MTLRILTINDFGTLVGSSILEPGIHNFKFSDNLIVPVQVVNENTIKINLSDIKGEIDNLIFPCFSKQSISKIAELTSLDESTVQLANKEIFLSYSLGSGNTSFLVVRDDVEFSIGTRMIRERY